MVDRIYANNVTPPPLEESDGRNEMEMDLAVTMAFEVT